MIGFVFRKQFKGEQALVNEAYRKLNKSYPDGDKLAILLYETQLHRDLLFAEESPLHERMAHIDLLHYRTEVMRYWEYAEEWPVLRFLRYYKATALRRMPFGLVYSHTGAPTPFYFHGAYKKRRRDDGIALQQEVSAFAREIDRQQKLGGA